MKVCKKHLKLLERGTTYELADEKDCVACKNPKIKKLSEIW
jgi:hypothetical protein